VITKVYFTLLVWFRQRPALKTSLSEPYILPELINRAEEAPDLLGTMEWLADSEYCRAADGNVLEARVDAISAINDAAARQAFWSAFEGRPGDYLARWRQAGAPV
jgi:hypothetical protein